MRFHTKIGSLVLGLGGRRGRTVRCLAGAAMLLSLLAMTVPGASAAARFHICLQVSGTWCPVGDMAVMRNWHTATLLPNGMVLVTGGDDTSCPGSCPAADSSQLYNPATQQFLFTTGPMNEDRIEHTATLLPNGLVLVAGGFGTNSATCSAELYNPSTGIWILTGSLHVCRAEHTATLLPNGEVLVAGGVDAQMNALSSAELYNPATATWTVTGAMSTRRSSHSAALLTNGTVLVAGGSGNNDLLLSSAEIYTPATGQWTFTTPMSTPRVGFPLVLLPFGIPMAVGGDDGAAINRGVLASTELYGVGEWKYYANRPMSTARVNETATLLLNHDVLVAGGVVANGSSTASAELYDFLTNTWSATGSMAIPLAGQTATLLQNGQVLVTGGDNTTAIEGQEQAGAEVYTP